jgi:acetoacetyl-CoA synthetase
VAFWNDGDGTKYHKAYFNKYPGIWHHGDFIAKTSHHGFVIHGRSDAVLNPGGVRIGTAEIYRQVEEIEEVIEALAVGQPFDGDERVILFVQLRPDIKLDHTLIDRIKKQIRSNTTPRHVPAKVIQVPDIPRTKNNKIAELAVKQVIIGHTVENTGSLLNPHALDFYKDIVELRD